MRHALFRLVRVRSASEIGAPPLPRTYGATTMRILRAVIATLRPNDGIFARPVDEGVLRTMLSFVPYLPAPLRWGLPLGLLALDLAPPLFRCGFRRFTRMDRTAAARYLGAFEHSRGPFLLLFEGLRSLVLMAFYQQPQILEALEITWQDRAGELVERRARLLGMAPELGNPKNAARVYAPAMVTFGATEDDSPQ